MFGVFFLQGHFLGSVKLAPGSAWPDCMDGASFAWFRQLFLQPAARGLQMEMISCQLIMCCLSISSAERKKE